MNAPNVSPSSPESVGMLQWFFRRGEHAILCEVTSRGRELFDVLIVPFWDPDSAIVESFTRPLDALRRHAQLARFLRESGWLLAERRSAYEAA